jgi:hypothetical protein
LQQRCKGNSSSWFNQKFMQQCCENNCRLPHTFRLLWYNCSFLITFTASFHQNSSYFLAKETNATSKKVVLRVIPTGDYTEFKFMIGVDSLRNTMDISRRKGVLDPGNATHDGDGMYWSWNSGYIIMKLEGTSPQVPADAAGNQKYRYHIGGFGGYNAKTFNNTRTVTLPLGSIAAKIGPTQQPTIEIVADVAKVFDGVQKVSLAQYPTIMFADFSTTVANNYASMC